MKALTKAELTLISGGGAISSALEDIEINFDDDLEFDLDLDLSGFQLSDQEVSAVNNQCATSTFPSTVFGGNNSQQPSHQPSRTKLYNTDPDKISEDQQELARDALDLAGDVASEDPIGFAADSAKTAADALKLQADSNPYVNHGIPW